MKQKMPRAFCRMVLSLWSLALSPICIWTPLRAEEAYIDEQIEEVYLTEGQALKIVLPNSKTIESTIVALTPEQRTRVEKYSRQLAAEPTFKIFIGRTGNRIDGYAILTEEIGMYKPITSIVGITPQGQVSQVAIMVYRESRGGDVKRKRFLQQYKGKRMGSPIQINKDIINVTGATLSVRSMNTQVRKALAIIHELYLNKGAAS